jgi:hypothetical protein
VPSAQAVPAINRLLAALPRNDREQLLANCKQIEPIFSEVLYRPGELISHIYFPTESFISLVTPINGDASLEVRLTGNEGTLGIGLMLGVDVAPFYAMVPGAGPAPRITALSFLHEHEQSPGPQQELKRYLFVSMSQIAQTAACTRFHMVEAHLARWLLITHDLAHSDHFHVTHELMAHMLGVRRVGITKAANSLLKQKFISYRREDITILDHVGLEAASYECYQADRDTYKRIMNHCDGGLSGTTPEFRPPPPPRS